MAKKNAENNSCPCQSGLDFARCCGPFLNNNTLILPETAEQLMRSRYCAYVLHNSRYLLTTWHPEHRPENLYFENMPSENSPSQWLGLKIKSTHMGHKEDDSGEVHFIARYKINGKAFRLEEKSRFLKINNRWFYTTGQII